MRRGAVAVAVALALGFAAGTASPAPDRATMLKREHEGRKWTTLVDACSAHIELGHWARDAGLVPQATAEYVRAAEVSEGKLPYPLKLLNIIRTYPDAVWKVVNKHPKALLDTYEKKAKKIEGDHQKARLKVAKEASKDGLFEEAYAEYCAVVRITDRPLQFDAKGQVVLDAGTIPLDVSERMKAESISVDGKVYLRDEFLALVPDVKEVFEADGERLRVRSARSADEAKDLLAIATALFPFLEDETDGRPTRKMQLFVFKERGSFSTWCEAAGRSAFRASSGLADGPTFTAIVCGEGGTAESLRGMALHELSHLFQYGVTPAIMPSWYSEGFAETYGGEGTFTWDGKTLVPGGLMSKGRIDSFRSPEGYLPLSDLLATDALKTLNADKAKGMRFYAESWAFRRYMKTAAPPALLQKFRLWETVCRGAALGADHAKPRGEDTAPANEAFQKAFGKDLPALEKGFKEWLATL